MRLADTVSRRRNPSPVCLALRPGDRPGAAGRHPRHLVQGLTMQTETDRFWRWTDRIGAGCYWLGLGLLAVHVLPQVLRVLLLGRP